MPGTSKVSPSSSEVDRFHSMHGFQVEGIESNDDRLLARNSGKIGFLACITSEATNSLTSSGSSEAFPCSFDHQHLFCCNLNQAKMSDLSPIDGKPPPPGDEYEEIREQVCDY